MEAGKGVCGIGDVGHAHQLGFTPFQPIAKRCADDRRSVRRFDRKQEMPHRGKHVGAVRRG